ncbi:MAG: MFS transporter, partial [Deltaproteobacteria bacterium]|nr:MFS transporter [Deltaproteobacteria bacterium]
MSTERPGNIALGQWEIYWGWIVVIGAFLMLSLNYGARYSFGVFVKPMFSEYGWSMSVISLSASINILIYALSGVASGWLLDRMAPRWIMTFGTFITAAGFFLAGFISSPSGLYLSYGLLCGVGGAGIGLVVSSSSVGKWFREKQGLAMGIATMGIGFGTMALTPLAGFVSKNYGWRSGFMTLGAVILIVGFSVSQLLMRRTQPEDYGLLPDGLQCDSEKKSSKHMATDCERAGVKFSIISLMR